MNIEKVRNFEEKIKGTSFSFTVSLAKERQESCAIAKMTAQCALYMGALKIFGTP